MPIQLTSLNRIETKLLNKVSMQGSLFTDACEVSEVLITLYFVSAV